MSPQVSVVLPVRNGEQFIGDAIRSLQQQTLKDWELIVVDDGSTDDTLHVVSRFDDDRVVVLQCPPRGLATTLNRGIAAARAVYIARLDADDMAAPERLERQLGHLESTPNAVLVGGPMRVVTEDSEYIYTQSVPGDPQAIRLSLRAGHSPFMHPSVTFRRDAALPAGLYCETLNGCGGEDAEFFRRLSTCGDLVNLPEVAGDYRITRGAISTKIVAMPRSAVRRRSLAIARVARGIATKDDYDFLETFLSSAQEVPADYAYHLRVGKAYLLQAQDARSARRHFLAALRSRPLALRASFNLARSFTTRPSGRIWP
jgi:glycosyltransferase involved in cell wall biosynthesis